MSRRKRLGRAELAAAPYSMGIMGQSMSFATESEISAAQLPASISSPFSAMPKSMATGPFAELYSKMSEAYKQIGGTAVKVVATTSISGPMSMTMTQSTWLTEIKAVDVDEKLLQIPDGYTARPPTL